MGETGSAPYISEFIGTFVLVFTIGCNILSGQTVWAGISIACSLTVMIYALGKSSGAHFNPAVSVALCLAGKVDGGWSEVAKYSVTQIAAGISAGAAYVALFGTSFNLQPAKGHSLVQAGFAELLYTFMLCFVVLNVAASNRHAGKNQFYGLAIGFVIVAGAYSAGAVSGGCFNPAVAIGIDVASADKGILYCLPYVIFELVGAAIAAFAYQSCRGDQDAVGANADDEAIESETQPASKLLSEFLGTYILVLTVGLNVLSGSAAGAFSIAASLMCMIFALGTVSGAHFNPAVTVAIWHSARDKISGSDAFQYIIVQIIGGILGAFTYSALMNGETFALKPAAYTWPQVVCAELIFTFVLCFVVLSVATVKSPLSEYFGFAIGMCVTVGGCAIGKISGGSLNPAVSFGISVSHFAKGGTLDGLITYSILQLVAGLASAGAFKITQRSEYREDKLPLRN